MVIQDIRRPQVTRTIGRMQHASILDSVRQTVRDVFGQLGAGPSIRMTEHILICEDLYCGRRFRCGAFEAVWFIEEAQIKVYGAQGRVVRVLSAADASPTDQTNALRAA